MTFTEQYIKMVDCEEIQNRRKYMHEWKYGDRWLERDKEGKIWNQVQVWNLRGGTIESYHLLGLKYKWDKGNKRWDILNALWLPTQQDLQRMSGLDDYEWFMKGSSGRGWEMHYQHLSGQHGIVTGDSMEELWLAFVMHELHHKQWNGNEWVSENSNPNASNKVTGNEVERKEG